VATPNYSYEKRQRELAKKRKKEEKAARKAQGGQGGQPAGDDQRPDADKAGTAEGASGEQSQA
jgi:hypothetical protein